jgi:hypothetical protein
MKKSKRVAKLFKNFKLFYNTVTGEHHIESELLARGVRFATNVLPAAEVFSQTYCNEYLADNLPVQFR